EHGVLADVLEDIKARQRADAQEAKAIRAERDSLKAQFNTLKGEAQALKAQALSVQAQIAKAQTHLSDTHTDPDPGAHAEAQAELDRLCGERDALTTEHAAKVSAQRQLKADIRQNADRLQALKARGETLLENDAAYTHKVEREERERVRREEAKDMSARRSAMRHRAEQHLEATTVTLADYTQVQTAVLSCQAEVRALLERDNRLRAEAARLRGRLTGLAELQGLLAREATLRHDASMAQAQTETAHRIQAHKDCTSHIVQETQVVTEMSSRLELQLTLNT
ncbi:hypothetical protein KIPB_002070, partial [Kipferlia bialata]